MTTVEPVVRYETPPGRQGQVDFGTFTLPWWLVTASRLLEFVPVGRLPLGLGERDRCCSASLPIY